MSLNSKSTNSLATIARAGGGMRLKIPGRATTEICVIARAAASGGGTLYLSGLTSRAVPELAKIARAGGGRVVFED